MRQRGNNMFNWPSTPDSVPYPSEQVIKLIDEPVKLTKSRHFSLKFHDWQSYLSILHVLWESMATL